jgi:hypothetical protein
MNSAAFAVRSFAPGDEAALVALANRAYDHYAGNVPRTVEHWRWSILARPGVTAADILLLSQAAGDLLGHAVLGPGGIVLEFCLAPELAGERRAEAARALKDGLEARALATGRESILFELPRSDARVRALLAATGYRFEESRSLQLLLVDVAAALTRLLEHRQGRMPHDWRPVFRLDLAPGRYRIPGPLVLRVAPGESRPVTPATGDAAYDIDVRTDLSTLTDLILRHTRFDEARAAGRIAVAPAAREQDARTLCAWLALKSPWYTPPADDRGSDGRAIHAGAAREPAAPFEIASYRPGEESALAGVLGAGRDGDWGDAAYWRWKHADRPGFRAADVLVARRAGGEIGGCFHGAVVDFKIEEGLAVPMSFDSDFAALTGLDGAAVADRVHDTSSAALAARSVVLRGGFTTREENARFYGPRFGYTLAPEVTIQFRKYLGPGALAPRVAELGTRLLARPPVCRALRRPLVIDLVIAGFPPCHAVLAADGFRLEPGVAAAADLRARLAYPLLTEFAGRSWPPWGALLHAMGRGDLAVSGLLKATPRLAALAVACLRPQANGR